ncbi:sodium-dependent glucose transporter 1-like [Brevipalpus obovatus]|uniref:sodium-dependent glucose transporter 1-like n=1 Tax=Brevipalpus obovatus TaxID=246614 RepID=UPI003D9E8BDC
MNAISETLSNVALVDIWEAEVGNYMQLLYLFYGIGGLITPILIRPFQLPIPEEAADDPDAYLSFYKPEEVQIQYPYFWITGASIVTGMLFIICYFVNQRNKGSAEKKEANEQEMQIPEVKTPNEKDSPSKVKITIAVGWVTALCHIGSSMHLTLSCFAQAYGVKSVFKMEKKKAALLSGLYWLVYCLGKIVFVFLSTLIGEKSLIYSISSLYFIGIILAFTLANSIEICLWAIPVFYAIGFGPLFNCAIADLEKYFHLTGRHTSIIFIGVCIGESIHVPIVGTFLDNWPDIYLYYTGSLSILFLAGFLVMPFICRALFEKTENPQIQELNVERKTSRFGSLIVPVPERRESIMSLVVPSSDRGSKKSNA